MCHLRIVNAGPECPAMMEARVVKECNGKRTWNGRCGGSNPADLGAGAVMEFHFEKAPAESWEQTLENRMHRSVVVGRAKSQAASASLYYNAAEQKFSLLLHSAASHRDEHLDCELREQHGGMAIVFLRINHGGFPAAVGHAVLRGKQLMARFKAGYTLLFAVDPYAPQFERLVVQRANGKAARRTPQAHDSGDFSETDLKRLRGEIAMHKCS